MPAATAIDLDRYPVDRRDAREYAAWCARIRAELDRTGVSILPGFVTAVAIDALVSEARSLAPLGHHSDVSGTPYLELPADDWPAGHPRVTWGHTALDAIAYDRFPADSILRAIYEWDPLLTFLTDALGFTVYRYDDPLGGLNLAAMRAGDELFWHFDQTDFVVSLAIQSSDAGGEFEYAPMIRTGDDERYDDVARLLAGDLPDAVAVPMTPGTLMLFEGRHSIHRVTPIVGATPRLVGLFGYDRAPGTCSSTLLREIRYGRPG